MKKTAAELDSEIAEALAGLHYYYVIDRRGHRTIYGPFDTRKDAEYAGYFAKPADERDELGAKRLLRVYFGRGVQGYDGNEIRSLLDDPGEWVPGLKSAKLKKGPPPVHPSWKEFDKRDKTFRLELRDKDYDFRLRDLE